MTDDHPVLTRVDRKNVERPGLSYSNPAALANRVSMNACMRAQNLAACGHDFTLARLAACLLFGRQVTIDEARVVTVRNEADLLRLFLFRHRQLIIARRLTRIVLRQFSQRKQRARKLILSQLPKKVRLILLRIAAAQQATTIARFVELNARVVTGGNFLAAKTRR